MNQWLSESEKLIKNEEKIGSDIGVLQEQIKDNQVRSFKRLNIPVLNMTSCRFESSLPLRKNVLNRLMKSSR